MITANFNVKELTKTINNIIDYSDGYIQESKQSEQKIAKKIAQTSINVFYEYLDSLARLHPDMLHHVYEWNGVGNPGSRLFTLKLNNLAKSFGVVASFLESTTVPDNGTEPFYDKATVMELGESIVVNEVDAQSLFFEINGEEFFRKGPITIANPGGEAVRGSFVRSFNEFYGNYFSEIYLRSIQFYKHLEEMNAYKRNIKIASRSGNPRTIGKNSATEWIATMPGDDLVG